MIQAIETRYKGYRFRSRLEARWACFFDAAEIAWQYELEGYVLPTGRYLPDFWLPQVRMFAEVKPERFDDDELAACIELTRGTGHECLLLDGPPDLRTYWATSSPLDDGSPAFTEYDIASCDRYWLTEGRFFWWNGSLEYEQPTRDGEDYFQAGDILKRAVVSARSARFEFGESGGVL